MSIQQEQAFICQHCKEATNSNNCIALVLCIIVAFAVGLFLGAIFL